jgi:hypothetical protein
MGGNSSKMENTKGLRAEQITAGDTGYNSLVLDAHVDPSAVKSMKVFTLVKDTIKKNKLAHLTCKGLLFESEGPNEEIFAKVEMIATNEIGVVNVLQLLNALKGKVNFTAFRIIGDFY